ncbi:hypothetical protein P3T32_000967 [Ralstonia sp. GP73]|jgi:hypothetical protein|nr:hypothetical protein [Ralstonia sp. GP73]
MRHQSHLGLFPLSDRPGVAYAAASAPVDHEYRPRPRFDAGRAALCDETAWSLVCKCRPVGTSSSERRQYFGKYSSGVPSDLRKRWQCRHAAMLEPVMYRNVDERRQYICAPPREGGRPTSTNVGNQRFDLVCAVAQPHQLTTLADEPKRLRINYTRPKQERLWFANSYEMGRFTWRKRSPAFEHR